MKTLISPSILSADFSKLGASAKKLVKCGADMIHCDVMDGVFVPNLTFGMKAVADLRKEVNIPLDVHLMIVQPERYIEQFVKCGADIVTIHLEALQQDNVRQTLRLIRSLGAKSGLSIKPDTSVASIAPYIDEVDLILVMSVEPGFGGQKFMPSALDKLKYLKGIVGKDVILQVDGGINDQTAKLAKLSGANCLVAGSAIFEAKDMAVAIDTLRNA